MQTTLAVVDLDADLGAMRVFELAEFSLDGHSAIGDAYFNAGGHWNRFFTYTGHVKALSFSFQPSAFSVKLRLKL